MQRTRAIVLSSCIALCAMQASAQTADLLISKSGTEATTAGDNIDYSIYVFNGGPSDAQNVVVTDGLPAGTTFVSLSANTGLFLCTAPAVGQGGTVQCTASAMVNQADTNFTITVKTNPNSPAGSITNAATISSSTTEGDPSDNSSSVTTGITPTQLASTNLSIKSMLGSSKVTPGATMSFQMVIGNDGPSTAHHVQFVDAVPLNATFVSATVTDPLGAFTCATPAPGAAATSFARHELRAARGERPAGVHSHVPRQQRGRSGNGPDEYGHAVERRVRPRCIEQHGQQHRHGNLAGAVGGSPPSRRWEAGRTLRSG